MPLHLHEPRTGADIGVRIGLPAMAKKIPLRTSAFVYVANADVLDSTSVSVPFVRLNMADACSVCPEEPVNSVVKVCAFALGAATMPTSIATA